MIKTLDLLLKESISTSYNILLADKNDTIKFHFLYVTFYNPDNDKLLFYVSR